jgi:hypothetical protein
MNTEQLRDALAECLLNNGHADWNDFDAGNVADWVMDVVGPIVAERDEARDMARSLLSMAEMADVVDEGYAAEVRTKVGNS